MVGTLATQIELVWPLEWPLLQRLGFEQEQRVLDLGCGTGEFAGRLADACPGAQILGLDLFAGHVTLARTKWAGAARPRLSFEVGDALATGLPARSQDVVALRHFLHALPRPEGVLEEARRVLRPGGLLYTLAEDYAGLIFDVTDAPKRMFNDSQPHALRLGTNLHHGREAFRLVRAAGFEDVHVDPLIVDTSNSDRETFARMLEFWGAGYDGFVAEALGITSEEARARFHALVDCVRDPDRYACWMNFAVSGRAPR